MLESILLPSTRKSRSPRDWFGIDVNAEPTHHPIHISEYQLYAVEKWIVDRSRPIQVLLVYTGDPNHRITLTAFTPSTHEDYDKAIHHLRRDGAKPKHTVHGVLMVTSLAHFRSDYTIVKIPDGDFLAVKDQLYANINLLRMGCSGRNALALDEPSDATKERFLSAYHLHVPSAHVKSSEHFPLSPSSPRNTKKEKDRALFTATVLELVKLIQAGLAIFSYYGSLSPPAPSVLLDGLLCDETAEGIHRWIAEIGEPCLGLEPTQRVADPSFVSALLSMVLAIRNKLAALVTSSASSSTAQLMPVPKDPFVYPYAFSLSLMSYLQHANAGTSNSPVPAAFHTTQMAPFIVSGFAPPVQSSSSTTATLPIGAVLSREILEHIDNMYDKSKSSENKRVRRVFKGKVDDRARSTGADSDGDESHSHSHFHSSVTRDKRAALSDSEAPHLHLLSGSPVNSIGSSSGNRVLGGISTLLLPGNTSLSTSLATSPGGHVGGAGSITEAITNLSIFLSISLSKEAGGSSFSSARRGANLKRIRGSVGGGIASVSGAGTSDYSVRMGMGKSLGVGTGKKKKQRESVDMGYFYSAGAVAGAAGLVVGPFGPSSSVGSGSGADAAVGGLVTPGSVDKGQDREKEVVVGGSVKALWGGRVMDLLKLREWCEEVAQSHQLGDSALILPSSTYLLGNSVSQRAVSGSTVGSQQSGASNAKEKFSKKQKDKGKDKETLKLTSAALLSVYSDGDLKSDAGRSTEGEESESVYPSTSNTPLIHPEMLSSNPLASASFGSLLGGRVRGKLGNWAGGLTKRKGQSVDFGSGPPQLHLNTQSVPSSARTSPVVTRKPMASSGMIPEDRLDADVRRPSAQARGASAPLLTTRLTKGSKRHTLGASPSNTPGTSRQPKPITRQSTNTSSGPQSPTLPPLVYPGDIAGPAEDDFDVEQDVLSSGQISPLSDHVNKSNNPFIASRSRSQLPRHFSLTLPPPQQDRNFLSISTINEKLSRLSDQRSAASSSVLPSARSSNTNLAILNANPRRTTFLDSGNTGEWTGNEDGSRAEDSTSGRPPPPPGLRRPTLGSTGTPRVSSWSDPVSARYILGGTPALPPMNIEPLYMGGRSDNDVDEMYEEEEGIGDLDSHLRGNIGRGMAPGGGGIESEGDIVSGSLVSQPLKTAQPILRARRTELVGSKNKGSDDAAVGDGSNSSKERREREKTRFHSLLSIVDQDGNYFLEEPAGTWDQQQPYSYDPDDADGLYSYAWGADEDDLYVDADLDDEEWTRRRRRRKGSKSWCDPLRRRSFQDLDDFYDMPVLATERMRVDVDMCGQVLVMLRREEHLKNVVACLEILNNSLSSVNGLLRQEYESHLVSLSHLASQTKVLADLDLQSTRTDNLSQQTNILRYEAEQFHVPSLYHAASLSRQKVLEMRHKVFGVHKVFDTTDPSLASAGLNSGGGSSGIQNAAPASRKKKGTGQSRVLPEGVRGAHGKFNRLQKRLDGQEVVVDWLGRTESEVEEEERLDRNGLDSRYDSQIRAGFGRVDSGDEDDGGWSEAGTSLKTVGAEAEAEDGDGDGDVVEHSSIRPMWLLRFFMGWGARWSARASAAVHVGPTSIQPEKDGSGDDGTAQDEQDQAQKDDDDTIVAFGENGSEKDR